MKNKNIALSMRSLRQKGNKKTNKTDSSVAPQSMVESIRQSMRVEGYNISKKDAREAIERSLKK